VLDADNLPTMMSFQSKDPTAPLRFAGPETPPPFEATSLVLKQTDLQRLDEMGRDAMTLFSSFVAAWEQSKVRDIEDAEAMLASLSPGGTEYEVRTDLRANRRFSGDGFLSQTRYHSVCQSADGSDGGTMKRELIAYHDPLTSGVVDIYDLTEGSASFARLSGSLAEDAVEPQPAFLISIPPFTASEHEWLRRAAKRWDTTRVLLPVRVKEVSFERLIDLRVPRVAAWFTRNLTRLRWLTDDDSEAPAFPNKMPLDRFADLLPTLTTQTLGGGNGATRIAGSWLRSLGAEAVVFPSARSNSFVEVRNGNVIAFYGWNLVDYRGAHPARLQSYDLTTAWIQHVSNEIDEPPLTLYADVALQSTGRRGGEGSWSWQNLEEANRAARLFASALHLYEWARGNVSMSAKQEFAKMLGATDRAEVLGQTSGWFVQALLADASARSAFLESASVGLSRDEAQLVDFPTTFRRMDERMAAGKAGKLDES